MIVFKYKKKRQFTTLSFSRDSEFLAAGGDFDDFIPIWEFATGEIAHNVPRIIGHSTQSIAFHPKAPWLYVAHSYGLTVYSTKTGELRELYGKNEFARNVAVDPNGKRLIGSHHKLWAARGKPLLTCFHIADSSNPATEWELTDAHKPNNMWTELVAFFANGRQFAAAERTNKGIWSSQIVIRKADSGDLTKIFHETCTDMHYAGTAAQALAVSPLGTSIVSRIDRRLHVFDVANPTAAPRVIVNTGKKHFTGIAFHPTGRYLAVTSNDATVKLFDATTWEIARTFEWNVGKLRSVCFSFDGNLAAAGSDAGQVVVWDVDL